MNNNEPIKNTKAQIEFGIETILISVFCSLGVNLIVSGIVMRGEALSCYLILCGFVICVGTLYYCLLRRLKSVEKVSTITGFVLYNAKDKEIVLIPGYEISVRMFNYIAYCGDEIIKSIWKNDPVVFWETTADESGFHIKRVNSESNTLINELLEYCILKELTTSVSSHFGQLEDSETVIISRENLPKSVLNNRFLNWLSAEKTNPVNTSISKQTPDSGSQILLIEDGTEEGKGVRVIAEAWKGNQTNMFEHFEMVLPKNGRIERGDRSISIEHPLFSLQIKHDLSGSNADLPLHFLQWYLGINDQESQYVSYQFNIKAKVAFKLRALLSVQWKKYYSWIDSFLSHLYRYASQDYYFDTIGWNCANTVIECLINKEALTKEQINRGDTHDQL